MATTKKANLRYQIQIREIVDKVKIMDAKTGKPRMTYQTKSKVIPVYGTDLSIDQIKRIIENALNSAEKN